MLWCVDNIEKILDAKPTTDTWTVRWLEILKEADIHPEIPEYGYGDPKSYGIMERAALQLIDTGAVRHGSECFNACRTHYGHPFYQRLDPCRQGS